MKKFNSKAWLLILFLLPVTLMAQFPEQQTGGGSPGDTVRYKTIIPEPKQGLLKNMDMIANMRFAEQNEFKDGEFTKARFVNQQFRLEIRGQVTDKIYFRFRDRYTRAQTSESVDNLSRSTDLAYIKVDISPKWSLSAGKMCADWGAFEFDYNPIDVYEYSDIIEYADNFLTGVGVSYTASPKNQFTLQVLDSRTKTFNELYGPQPNLTEAKAALAFVSNWRGNLFDGKVKTTWSYSLFTEAKGTFMNYIALGTELTLGKFVAAYDYKWSDEQLDRTSLVSTIVPDSIYPYALKNTQYIGHWLHLHYRVSPKVNLALFWMLDIAKWKNSAENGGNTSGSDVISTNWGYIPTIEYYPWSTVNLRFFVNYVGRIYDYSDYTKTRLGANDYNTGRFQVGFVTPLGIF
jgi:hypothetical protein